MLLEDLIDMIQEFLGLERDDSVMEKVMDENMKANDDDNAISKLDDMYADGARLLSLVQSKTPGGNMLSMLDGVLMDEMKISKDLTAWPCESFHSVGEPGDRFHMSPIIQHISRAMSPNCTAPFTSCFVKRDTCEYNGDGQCS
jgi:hypothetical protein